ncbi:MAG: hypothetical protein M3Y53_03775 [Thermoproteota archaeon]|nr:hypothetical protein [Thermoproteota archaeon]
MKLKDISSTVGVVIGIGIVTIAAAASTILAMDVSQSPQINLSTTKASGTQPLLTAPVTVSASPLPPQATQISTLTRGLYLFNTTCIALHEIM